MENPTATQATSGISVKTAAALSYFTLIPAIYFLLAKPFDRSPLVRFHSLQSILFGLVAFGAQLLLMMLVVPRYGWMSTGILSLAFFFFWIAAVMKAMKGEWFKLPIIGDFAMAHSKTA
jgi:uncharacterized membrane protein